MLRVTAILLATTVATTAAAVARAPIIIQTSAYWQAFVTRDNDNGGIMCGMRGPDATSGLMIKYAGEGVFIQIFKAGWKIPAGTPIPSWVAFDHDDHLHFEGVSRANPAGSDFVEFWLDPLTEASFLSAFEDADKMVVGFDQGTQPPLGIKMVGSRAATIAFRRCAGVLDRKLGNPTQPFVSPQPYGDFAE